MSRSFCIDFKSYSLLYVVGADRNVLKRCVDGIDLASILIDEGFNNFENPYVYNRMKGRDINSLREQVAGAVLGIPRDALVSVRRLGNNQHIVLVTLKY